MERHALQPLEPTVEAGAEERAGEAVLPGHRKLPRTYASRWAKIVALGGIVENLATSAMWRDLLPKMRKKQ